MASSSDTNGTEHADYCSNCGAPLRGPYCHRCGQEARERIAPMQTIAKDLLSELFNFDTRLVRTLRRLLLQPGRLTVEYVAGRRANYVPPLRLFVFSSFVLFLLLGILSTQTVSIQGSASNALDSLATVERQQASPPPEADTEAPVDVASNDPIHVPEEVVSSIEAKIDSLRDVSSVRGRMHYALLRGLLRADRNPQRFLQQLVGRLSGLAFLLVPVFALLLKGLYLRSGRLYIEHLIFALHAHAVLFLLLIIIVLIALLDISTTLGYVQAAAFWGAGLHLLLSLRRTYQQGWIKTSVKWVTLLFCYVILISVALALYTLLTFILF